MSACDCPSTESKAQKHRGTKIKSDADLQYTELLVKLEQAQEKIQCLQAEIEENTYRQEVEAYRKILEQERAAAAQMHEVLKKVHTYFLCGTGGPTSHFVDVLIPGDLPWEIEQALDAWAVVIDSTPKGGGLLV